MKKKTFFETRIRIKKQSKLREIITPKITSTSKQKREKHEKNETRIFKTRNRIENAVKPRRDSRYHANSKKKRQKTSKNVFSKLESESRSHKN